jgi:hypothetical protein
VYDLAPLRRGFFVAFPDVDFVTMLSTRRRVDPVFLDIRRVDPRQ